jgi:hypothetical protein
MKRFLAVAVAAIAVVAVGIGLDPLGQAGADLGNESADSVRFVLNDPVLPDGSARTIGHTVYCGVRTRAEPFVLDVAVTNPPELVDPEDPDSLRVRGHEGTGWLGVQLQGEEAVDRGFREFRVPANDSFAFGLSLGGRPGEDQLVSIQSQPLGDESGNGAPFEGLASVRTRGGAVDPFVGDGASDNFCVSIGVPGGLPAEYEEGDISVPLAVPDEWVLDGNGADGGVLAGVPH